MNIALAAALAIPVPSPAPPQADLPPIVVQVTFPAAPPEDPTAPAPSFDQLEVRARFSRSVPFQPGVEPGPASVEPEGLAVGEDGLLRIPRPDGSWMFSLTVESDHATGSLGSEALVAEGGPIELVLHRGRPVTLRLVPPADTKYDPLALVGRALPLRCFQHVATARERFDTRTAEVDEALELHLRAFALGEDPHRPGFRPTPLAQQLLPYAIDPTWQPPAPEDGAVIEVPLVETCTAQVRAIDPDGAPVPAAKVRCTPDGRRTLHGWSSVAHDGVVPVPGLLAGPFVLVVEAADFESSTTAHVAAPGDLPIEVVLRPLGRVALDRPDDASGELRLARLVTSGRPEARAAQGEVDGRPVFATEGPGLHVLQWRDAAAAGGPAFVATGACFVVVPRDARTGRVAGRAIPAPDLGRYTTRRAGSGRGDDLLPSWTTPTTGALAGQGTGGIRLRPYLEGAEEADSLEGVAVARIAGGWRAGGPRYLRLPEGLDADGSVMAEELEPGPYLVELLSRDGWNSALVAFDVVPGEQRDLGRVALGPKGLLAVRGTAGGPDAALVYGCGSPGTGAQHLPVLTPVRSDGMAALPRGATWVASHWTSPTTGRVEVETQAIPPQLPGRAGGEAVVVGREEPGDPLDVAVVDDAGLPFALAVCELHWDDGSRRSALLDRDGSGSIPLRSAGPPPSELWILPPDEPGATPIPDRGPVLRLPLKGRTGLDEAVAVEVPSATVEGHFQSTRGPGTGRRIALVPWPVPAGLRPEDLQTGALRPDGSFVIRCAPEGRYVAAVLDGHLARPTVVVEDGLPLWVVATSAPFDVARSARVEGLELQQGAGVRLPETW